MHQSTIPFLSETIWPRWESRHFLTVPVVQTWLPVTFGYSLSSRKNLEAVVMRQLRRWKKLWHAHTRWLRWSLPEDIWRVKKVHCNRRRLLRRGLEFHVCTINKCAHTKKSENILWTSYISIYLSIYLRWFICISLSVCPLDHRSLSIYIYIYIPVDLYASVYRSVYLSMPVYSNLSI